MRTEALDLVQAARQKSREPEPAGAAR